MAIIATIKAAIAGARSGGSVSSSAIFGTALVVGATYAAAGAVVKASVGGLATCRSLASLGLLVFHQSSGLPFLGTAGAGPRLCTPVAFTA